MIHVDLRLAQRIERIAALHNADYARVQAEHQPDSGAAAQAIGSGIAAFACTDWPTNAAVGLGLDDVSSSDQLDEVEAFFASRAVAPVVTVCPFTDRDLLRRLGQRRYYIAQFMNMHVRAITPHDADSPTDADICVTQVTSDQADEWARVNVRSSLGEDHIPADDRRLALARVSIRLPGVAGFIAWIEGQPAGAAAVSLRDGVATLFATSTHPRFRRRGVQAALIRARLAYAQRAGCDLAIVTTPPGSDSQRNVVRYGFGVSYTRVAFTREHAE